MGRRRRNTVEVPIRLNQTREEVKEHEIEARADRILSKCLELEPDWLDIAFIQNPKKTKDELNKDMSIDKDKGTNWSLL
ncbi:hypothetical protein JG688_00015296 [Phytophthora aleatoria]|uniref:Uncharacterized protein n=1 Tax=Phytophthora aleatoria TaxID=2496075 RepID=A0A8J5LWY6_9STRA|nr:hypothetical protein JG688_00015296 [Phytophthora aleatoria]